MTNPLVTPFKVYTMRDKLAILHELDRCQGNLSVQKLMAAHRLTTEEIHEWRTKFANGGITNLRATRKVKA